MRKLVIFTLILLSEVAMCQSPGPRTLYDQGKYQEALEAIEKNGLKSAVDYYNAGNCLFKMGKLGQALSYYRKAEIMDQSGMEDISYNRELTEKTLDKNGLLSKPTNPWVGFYLNRFIPFSKRLGIEGLSLFFSVPALLMGFFLFRGRKKGLNPRDLFFSPNLLICMVLTFLFWAVGGIGLHASRTKLATVLGDSTSARSGPSDKFTELFKLPAGSLVQLRQEKREGWQQVRFSLGKVGWVAEKELLEL